MAHPHFYFPRPYPDELIGSLILRACVHRGISLKTMSGMLAGRCRSYCSLAMSSCLDEIATATDSDAMTLLWENTVFPYATAYMSATETDRLAYSLLQNDHIGNAALTQATTQGGLGQRFCLQCLHEDETRFGETYWHREHNLPLVLTCRKHHLPLRVLEHPAELSVYHKLAIRVLPERELGISRGSPLSSDLAQAITVLSARLLTSRDRKEPCDWYREYRNLASGKGLMHKGGGLASEVFAQAFRSAYGHAFLQDAGLEFRSGKGAWPALMLREKQGTPFITPKHVLLKVFLERAELPGTANMYLPPGRATRDYAALDAQYSHKVSKAIRAAQLRNARMGVIQMLTGLGILSTFRHNRDKLPKTRALLAEFKGTAFSARQTGRRPRKRVVKKIQ